MRVSLVVWILTLIGLTALLLGDLFVIGRRPHEPRTRESVAWVCFYFALAIGFGAGVWALAGGQSGQEFFTGYLTEYSLSVDNLFVFVIIMSRFAVPRHLQQEVLFFGIVIALILRGAFIAGGAALINEFSWIFYVFGAFLLYTALRLARHGEDDPSDFKENVLIRVSRRLLPMSRHYEGTKLMIREPEGRGRRLFTPMLIVMIAIGTTDLIFALDSIPAIFGLTTQPYLVFTVNVFALMGLRQLYFLLGGLLNRLTYLSVGLSIILGFIGVKLILAALHDNRVGFINGGKPIEGLPTIPIWFSLAFIVVVLFITTVVSLVRSRRLARATAGASVVTASLPMSSMPIGGNNGGAPADGSSVQPTLPSSEGEIR